MEKDPKSMILADAIETAIRTQRKLVIYQRITAGLCGVILVLVIALMIGG